MTTRLQEKRMAFEAKRGNEGRAENSPYEDVKAKLGKWLHVSDPEAVEIILATAVATYLKGDPLWVLLVGPSGGGKTEILNMFTDAEDVMVLSKMTSHTLMSGLSTVKEGEDLIYQLDGKLLVIKDLAPILEMGRDEQKEVLSDLRDAFDGLVVRAWGSGKPRTEWRGKFGLIAAATAAIDKHWKFFTELGERYLRINLHTDAEKQTHAALEKMGQEDEMREEMRIAGRELMAHYKGLDSSTKLPEYFRVMVGNLANAIAVLRTHVSRSRDHEIQYMPQPEVGTRLGKELLKLAEAATFLKGLKEPGDEQYELLLRAATDSIPTRRSAVLAALLQGKCSQADIKEATSIPLSTVKHELEDLRMLGVTIWDNSDKEWHLVEEFEQKLRESDLADALTRNVPPAAKEDK